MLYGILYPIFRTLTDFWAQIFNHLVQFSLNSFWGKWGSKKRHFDHSCKIFVEVPRILVPYHEDLLDIVIPLVNTSLYQIPNRILTPIRLMLWQEITKYPMKIENEFKRNLTSTNQKIRFKLLHDITPWQMKCIYASFLLGGGWGWMAGETRSLISS